MKPVKLFLLTVLVTTSQGAHADEQPDEVLPAVLELSSDAVPIATLRTVDPEVPVMVPACRGLMWEVLDTENGLYVPLSDQPCPPSQPALVVGTRGIKSDPPAPPAYPAAVRAIALVGTGCTPDYPFEIAGCEHVHTVTTSPITIQAPAE